MEKNRGADIAPQGEGVVVPVLGGGNYRYVPGGGYVTREIEHVLCQFVTNADKPIRAAFSGRPNRSW